MSKLYNLEKVLELAEGDQSFVQLLVDTFLEEIPEDLEKMTHAVGDNDSKTAYQFAHKMKPNFLLFGIDVVDKVRLLEGWKDGNISFDEAQPALVFVKETANIAITQLQQDFKHD